MPRVFSREASRAIDREAESRYGIPSIVLMENAAIALRDEALKMVSGRRVAESLTVNPQSSIARIAVVCGSGNNGGDGYALARHLHNAGCRVDIIALGEPRDGTDARINREICTRMNLVIRPFERMHAGSGGGSNPFEGFDLLVDAIFGTGLDRPIEGAAADLVRWIDTSGVPILAADIPSGLDCDTGHPLGPAESIIRAARTVSFVGLKKGFVANPASRDFTGHIVIGDIGVPRELVEEFGEEA